MFKSEVKWPHVTNDYIIGQCKSTALTYTGRKELVNAGVPTSSALAGVAM